jgi:hypothetical protein
VIGGAQFSLFPLGKGAPANDLIIPVRAKGAAA